MTPPTKRADPVVVPIPLLDDQKPGIEANRPDAARYSAFIVS